MCCPCRPICFSPKESCRRDSGAGGMPRARAAEIRAMPLFAGLKSELLQQMMADATVITAPRGTLLFTLGSNADCFYLVLTGQVKLFALLCDGRESIIEIIHPVASFGEAAMLAGQGFPVNAEIIEDADLIRVGKRAFLNSLHRDHAVAYRMLAAMSAWQHRLAGEANLLRQQPAWQRVAEYLLSLASTDNSEAVIRLPFSKEVLASRIGIRRESLSRVLARMRLFGVETSGSTIRIRDLDLLRGMLRRGGTLAVTESVTVGVTMGVAGAVAGGVAGGVTELERGSSRR